MLGRNRGLHKKASTQDIREFLGVHSTAASRNSVNVFVNPLAIETPTTTYPCPCSFLIRALATALTALTIEENCAQPEI